MESITLEAPLQRATDVEPAVQLLTALFDQRDIVLFRPIETWTETGRKRSALIIESSAIAPPNPRHCSTPSNA